MNYQNTNLCHTHNHTHIHNHTHTQHTLTLNTQHSLTTATQHSLCVEQVGEGGHGGGVGQAGQRVGRGLAQQVVVERGHAGGGKAQHEAVEREVVHAPAREGVGIVLRPFHA